MREPGDTTDRQALAALDLVGTWLLDAWTVEFSDGRATSYPFGAVPSGVLIYSADGWMNACISRSGRPALSSESARTAPDVERLRAFDSFFQYAGRYELLTLDGLPAVAHHVTHSLNPNFVGTVQRRRIRASASGGIELSGVDTVPGTQVVRRHRLAWSRAIQSPA